MRSVGFLGAAALVVAACSSNEGSDALARGDAPSSHWMSIGGGMVSLDAGIPPTGGGDGTGGSKATTSSSSSSSSSAGGTGGTSSASSSSSSSASGVGGGTSSASSSSSASGVGGGTSSAASSSSSASGTGGAGGKEATSAASSSSGMTMLSIDGSPCLMNLECVSGSCVDSVCCHTACDGVCAACTKAKKGGGDDGVCGFIPAESDPDSECEAKAPPCGAPGLCNGSGACQPTPDGKVCVDGSCVGGNETAPSLCSGGVCVVAMAHACPTPMICKDAFVCQQACVGDTDCPPTQFCSSGSCVLHFVPGTACTAPSQCGSGACVDGVCCDKACDAGPCEVCTAAKGATKDGACTPLNGAPPVVDACADPAKCTDDVCSGGACAHVAKVCPAANACAQAGTCDPDTGACVAGAPVKCPLDGLAACETRVCDVAAQGCVERSKLDGTPCSAADRDGICVAGSCFTVVGVSGSGGAGGATATSAAATSASAATGAGGGGGAGGSGGDGRFHFAGGACSVGGSNEGRLAWILAGLLFAARRRSKRGAATSTRGARDA